MEEKAYVYQIRNKTNDKLYIGSSKRIESRLWTHKNELKKGTHVNKKLQNAWNKYGEDNFEFETIEECNLEEQYVREQYYMDLHEVCKSGYNILSTAKYGHADGQPWVKGENSNLAKITENQAYGVKLMDSLGYKPKEISEKLDVTESNVRNILDLTTWIDVGKEFNKRLKQNKEENKIKKKNYELAVDEYFYTKYL